MMTTDDDAGMYRFGQRRPIKHGCVQQIRPIRRSCADRNQTVLNIFSFNTTILFNYQK